MTVPAKRFTINTGTSLMIGLGLLVALLGLLGMRPQAVRAAGPVLYVAPGGSDTADCTNSASPCATVQYAVDQADPGAEIRVAAGTYTGVNVRPRSDVLSTGVVTQMVYLSKTVAIRGGYTPGFAAPPDPVANPTTLDVQGQGRALYITGNISPTIEGLRITKGNATGLGGAPFDDHAGGGVYVVTATATLSGNQVFSNTADYGGGLYLFESAATLTRNTITANSANNDGGGLYLELSPATLNSNSVVVNAAGQNGGGLYLSSSSAMLSVNTVSSKSVFWNSEADRFWQ